MYIKENYIIIFFVCFPSGASTFICMILTHAQQNYIETENKILNQTKVCNLSTF